jgi:hypothetical protein
MTCRNILRSTLTRYLPCSCSECLKSGSLLRQLLSLKGGRLFSCSHCSKSFSRSGHWQIHLRGHTCEKPLSCKAFSKSFSRSDKLKLHMNRNLPMSVSYSCSLCTIPFARAVYLKEHLKLSKVTRVRNSVNMLLVYSFLCWVIELTEAPKISLWRETLQLFLMQKVLCLVIFFATSFESSH